MFLLKYTLLFILSKKSELKAKFLFKNKVTKSSENAVSLVSNVGWAVCVLLLQLGSVWAELLLSGSVWVLMSLWMVSLPWVVVL